MIFFKHTLRIYPPSGKILPPTRRAGVTAQTEPGMYSRDGNLNIEVGEGKSIMIKEGGKDEVDLLASLADLEAQLATYEDGFGEAVNKAINRKEVYVEGLKGVIPSILGSLFRQNKYVGVLHYTHHFCLHHTTRGKTWKRLRCSLLTMRALAWTVSIKSPPWGQLPFCT